MEIVLKHEISSGRPVYRPMCELSKLITGIYGKKSFSLSMIERAKKLGITVKEQSAHK